MVGADEGASSGQMPAILTPAQCRAARGLLGWSQGDLAGRSGFDEGLVRSFEDETSETPSGQLEALRSTLMQAGTVFSDADGGGVRLSGQGAGDGTHLDDLTTENDR